MFDSMYNLSSGTFVMNKKMRDANFKLSSFDSDLMRLYYEADKLGYEEVESDRGIFIYKSGHRQLLHFNESDYTAFSFSNKFYLVKKKYRTNRELYFVGNEDSAEQLCVSNTASGDALILQLFVGDNISSTHAKVRAQISPKKTTTAMVPSTPTTNSASIITTSIFLFSLLAYFFMAR
ncbi:unnamed protein product [Toxocara canis]|nr:unnamed protein product [Toxocara canis]